MRSNKKLAIVTCHKFPNLSPSDYGLPTVFEAYGWEVRVVIWNDPVVEWQYFDSVLIRNTWDYYEHIDAFLVWVQHLANLGVRLFNPPSVILWNVNKYYLRELTQRDIPVIPTVYFSKNILAELPALPSEFGSRCVIKPVISAGSYHTKQFHMQDWAEMAVAFGQLPLSCDFMVQPFLPQIQTRGEYSFVYFGGQHMYTVNKRPVENDFRVQIQYGGQYTLVEMGLYVMDQVERIYEQAVPADCLYARIDGVLDEKDRFVLMEIELIEPDLYFHLQPSAMDRLVQALERMSGI